MSELEKIQIKKLEALGIEVDVFDDDEPYDVQREKDVSEATLLVLQGKEVPEELEERLLEYKRKHQVAETMG